MSFEEHFLQAFFQVPLFLDQGENTPGKTTAEIQSVKIQAKSGEIPVRKNVGKIMQSVDSFRLRSKSAKLICYRIIKIQS